LCQQPDRPSTGRQLRYPSPHARHPASGWVPYRWDKPGSQWASRSPGPCPPFWQRCNHQPQPSQPGQPKPKGHRHRCPGAKPDAPAKPRAATPTPAAAPYRVTLKLPGADPSAPAEVVTRALRAAGVPFEVETIERIGAGSDASTSSRPAALRATPAPAVR